MKSLLSPGQRKRLMTLWGQLVQKSLDAGAGERQERLAWAGRVLGRELASFNDLARHEAARLIDELQALLGITGSREKAEAAGAEGRRGRRARHMTLAGAAEIERIQQALARLGWNKDRFEAWLRSPASPLGRKASGAVPQIRTLGEANRVWWALKRMLKRQGLWREEPKKEQASA